MKLLHASSLLLLLGVVSAVPSGLEVRDDRDKVPITLVDQPDQSASFRCGKHTYTGSDIYQAVQYAVALQSSGQTQGAHKYPQAFNNDDYKGNKLSFPNTCPADTNRQEYPLVSSPAYNGGKNNKNYRDERVVYYNKYEDDGDGHAKVYYCGIMTHDGANTGGFLLY
ncbi:MAG: hypothetical protein FRX48_09573 [Lasallia pustulata]|uniref:ribonuclease T1 n=1 Tax=Lasallia pustulata TaxID=136370 RepID=A0A5M8PBL6_9LECA|nr:MAG: hypothetical protein FRX48_09573 [Lasallia pustulata]